MHPSINDRKQGDAVFNGISHAAEGRAVSSVSELLGEVVVLGRPGVGRFHSCLN